jgi:hypothetical protein
LGKAETQDILLERGLQIENVDPSARAILLSSKASRLIQTGKIDTAEKFLNEAATTFESLGDVRFVVAPYPAVLIEAFVFEGFCRPLAFAQILRASRFAASEADAIFGGAALGFGALALFAVFVEVDWPIFGHCERLQGVGDGGLVAAQRREVVGKGMAGEAPVMAAVEGRRQAEMRGAL